MMKYTSILVVFLMGCEMPKPVIPVAPSAPNSNKAIIKYVDEDAVCYTYLVNSISCIPRGIK